MPLRVIARRNDEAIQAIAFLGLIPWTASCLAVTRSDAGLRRPASHSLVSRDLLKLRKHFLHDLTVEEVDDAVGVAGVAL